MWALLKLTQCSILGSFGKIENQSTSLTGTEGTYGLLVVFCRPILDISKLASSTAWDLTVLQAKTPLAIAKGTCRSRWRDKVDILEIMCLQTHLYFSTRIQVFFCTYNAKAVQGAEIGRVEGWTAVDVKSGKVSASSLIAGGWFY